MAKRVILGILLSMVVMLMVGTAAFAAPPPDTASCLAFCNPNSPQGVFCGAGARNIAQGALPLGGPGASGHAQLTLYGVYDVYGVPHP